MVRLESRLSRLEAQRPVDRRCDHCRTWPSWRVIYREEGQHARPIPSRDAVPSVAGSPICSW
jgi:hypothetical protein